MLWLEGGRKAKFGKNLSVEYPRILRACRWRDNIKEKSLGKVGGVTKMRLIIKRRCPYYF